MGLCVGYVHGESIEPTYLREYMQRDSEHARACAVRTGIHLHGVTANLNEARPLPAYFELGGLTPAYLHYAGAMYVAGSLRIRLWDPCFTSA